MVYLLRKSVFAENERSEGCFRESTVKHALVTAEREEKERGKGIPGERAAEEKINETGRKVGQERILL